jgi:hypothetical protein
MRHFKWIDRNLETIEARALSSDEIEAAFDRVYSLEEHPDGSYRMLAETPSGRRVWIVWRYDREDDRKPQTSLATWASLRTS